MRLIGGKDYYDGVTGFDTDARLTFVRSNFTKTEYRPKDKVYNLEQKLFLTTRSVERSLRYGDGADMEQITIIFCGKVYRGMMRIEDKFMHETNAHQVTYHMYWTPDALLAELERQKFKIYEKEWFWDKTHRSVSEDNLAEFFEPTEVPSKVLETLIAENVVHSIGFNVAAQLSHGQFPHWYDNTDGLKYYGFASVVEPWQAYQQIDMWLGSQLAKEEDNMVRLNDKELIAKHGFDKVSFRNTHHVGKPRGQK